MAPPPDNRRHLLVEGLVTAEAYSSEKGGGGGQPPERDRTPHGQRLLSQLDDAHKSEGSRDERREARGVSTHRGLLLEFVSDPGLELRLQSLENRTQGIELLAVREVDEQQRAVVHVPDQKVGYFNKVLEDYVQEDTKGGKPKNERLVSTVAEIRLAVLESLWTDDTDQLPADDEEIWWEVWLRRETVDEPPPELLRFQREAQQLGVKVIQKALPFPDRLVTLAFGSLTNMKDCAELLGSIAELRRAKETAADYLRLSPSEQAEWVEELRARIVPPSATAPAVCLLDTGVDGGHPLLEASLGPEDRHTNEPGWGVEDRDGHGTEMAGVAALGDLTPLLSSTNPVQLSHRLESVKILDPPAQNDPDLYGASTGEAVARAETAAPARARAICLSVTTKDGRDRGRPSSWSAALDDLIAGTLDGERRLVCVSAGNTRADGWLDYPVSNETDAIHDPGQAWNALTIGAYTRKADINEPDYAGWTPLAQPHDLGPTSTTSRTWAKGWPIKPDLVVEGGNLAVNPPRDQASSLDSLQLLTTRSRMAEFGSGLLSCIGDTSAASALAASMAARVQGQYPDLWPETIRALLVHSADWTKAMTDRYVVDPKRRGDWGNLVRCCGFGVPSLDRALWSAGNSLTLIAQESIRPYERPPKKSPTMREMHLHPLPWPRAELAALAETPVELRVTLSYYIEASPGQRGWKYRHRYASHGLRFDVKTPTETEQQFRWRLNRKAREEEDGRKDSKADTKRWRLGPDLRSLGSIHSDTWGGTAVELAERGLIGIYPVIGWWRERPDLGKVDRSTRYALVVSIRTPAQAVDLYTPVAEQIAARVSIPLEG